MQRSVSNHFLSTFEPVVASDEPQNSLILRRLSDERQVILKVGDNFACRRSNLPLSEKLSETFGYDEFWQNVDALLNQAYSHSSLVEDCTATSTSQYCDCIGLALLHRVPQLCLCNRSLTGPITKSLSENSTVSPVS